MEKLEEKVEEVKEVEDVKFSWGNVVRGWIQNLKDDVDPAIKGAKMGLFGLHAIPTWMRQHDEGKMSSDKPGLSALLGLVVAGSSVAGYVAAGDQINRATDSEMGYALAGVPLACQGISWTYEAFLRAKKTEQSKVVMTRLRRSFEDTSDGEYALSNKQLVEILADKLYTTKEKEVNREIKRNQTYITNARKNQQYDEEETKRQVIEYKTEINTLEEKLGKYKSKSLKHAEKGILYAASNIFNGLVADNNVGKEYDMSIEISTGPNKRHKDKRNSLKAVYDEFDDEEFSRVYFQSDITGMIGTTIKETLQENKGSASIELFGDLMQVYTNDGKDTHYQVKPNHIWEV